MKQLYLNPKNHLEAFSENAPGRIPYMVVTKPYTFENIMEIFPDKLESEGINVDGMYVPISIRVEKGYIRAEFPSGKEMTIIENELLEERNPYTLYKEVYKQAQKEAFILWLNVKVNSVLGKDDINVSVRKYYAEFSRIPKYSITNGEINVWFNEDFTFSHCAMPEQEIWRDGYASINLEETIAEYQRLKVIKDLILNAVEQAKKEINENKL